MIAARSMAMIESVLNKHDFYQQTVDSVYVRARDFALRHPSLNKSGGSAQHASNKFREQLTKDVTQSVMNAFKSSVRNRFQNRNNSSQPGGGFTHVSRETDIPTPRMQKLRQKETRSFLV